MPGIGVEFTRLRRFSCTNARDPPSRWENLPLVISHAGRARAAGSTSIVAQPDPRTTWALTSTAGRFAFGNVGSHQGVTSGTAGGPLSKSYDRVRKPGKFSPTLTPFGSRARPTRNQAKEFSNAMAVSLSCETQAETNHPRALNKAGCPFPRMSETSGQCEKDIPIRRNAHNKCIAWPRRIRNKGGRGALGRWIDESCAAGETVP